MEERRKERRDRKVEQTRVEIVEAWVRVFTRKGFTATTMEDVAREVGCSTGTLYNYFDSKEALVEAVCDWVGDQALSVLAIAVPPGTTFPARLRFIQEQFVARMEEHREVHLAFERMQLHTSLVEHFSDKLAQYREIIVELLRQGVAEGYIPETKLNLYATYFMALGDGIMHHWALQGGKTPLADEMAEFVDFFLRGARE